MGKRINQLRAAAAEARARGMDAAEREKMRRAAQDKLDDGFRVAGETSVGAAAGGAVRRFGAVAAQVPMMSYWNDELQERFGVRILVEHVRADPGDPVAHMWLAEAMAAMNKQKAVRDTARMLNSPSAIAMRAVARVGVERRDPVESALTRAQGIATRKLRADKRDAEALWTIARVYLLRKQPDKAVMPARLAATAGSGPTRGAALATLSRAYFDLRQDAEARKAAVAAIRSECSIGWMTIAALARRAGDTSASRLGMTERLAQYEKAEKALARVTDADRERYYGHVAPGELAIAKATLGVQATKLKEGVSQLKRGLGRRGHS